MQSIPKTLKEKTKGVNKKQLALKCAPYVIFGYVLNKVSWLYGQQAGDNTLQKVLDTINGIGGAFHNPLPSFLPRDLLVGVGCGIGFRMVVYYKAKNAKKFRQGVEYGSARWGTAKDIEPYVDPVFENNVLLTATERLMMSGRPKQPKYARNKNILVIGGSGSGKTRFFVKPNLMQMHSSYVVTDPKGTVLVECGKMLSKNNYRIKVLNTINFAKSMHYNPFAYIRSEKDILKLVNTIIVNTKGEGQQASEDFWVKAEKLYYTALSAYIWYEAPEEEQNFSMLIDLVDASEAREDDENFKNAVDLLGVSGLCHNLHRTGLFHLIDDGVKEDAIAFGFHLKALQVLLLDGKDRQLLAVVDQALEVGLAGELLIVVGKGNQKGGKIFRPQPCQLEGTFGDLDALTHHQVSGFTVGTHARVPPCSLDFPAVQPAPAGIVGIPLECPIVSCGTDAAPRAFHAGRQSAVGSLRYTWLVLLHRWCSSFPDKVVFSVPPASECPTPAHGYAAPAPLR